MPGDDAREKPAENAAKPDVLPPPAADRELTDDELDKMSGGRRHDEALKDVFKKSLDLSPNAR